MNAVILAVVVMLVLAVLRMHVVLALLIGAIVGGLMSGLGVTETLASFSEGMKGGAGIAELCLARVLCRSHRPLRGTQSPSPLHHHPT